MKSRRYIAIAFVAVLVIQIIFLVAQIPGTYAKPKNLSVAFVNEDEGAMGGTLFEMIKTQMATNKSDDNSVITWIQLESETEMKENMADKKIYGAVIIPKQFSSQYASLQSAKPTSAVIHLYVNEGRNAAVATLTTQALQQLVTQMNGAISNQILSLVEQQNVPLSVSQAKILMSPIQSTTTKLHPTGDLANTPTAFFQPIWLATYATVLLWMFGKSRIFQSLKEQLSFRLLQTCTAIVLGAFSGYMVAWLASLILGYNFENYWTLASFLAIASICFMLLFLGLTQWIRLGSIGLIILLMFFGAPLLQLVPEVMPTFYADWVYPWLPMRFMVDGVKDILFYESGIWSHNTMILLVAGGIGALLVLTKGSAKAHEVTSAVRELN